MEHVPWNAGMRTRKFLQRGYLLLFAPAVHSDFKLTAVNEFLILQTASWESNRDNLNATVFLRRIKKVLL